MELSVVIPCLNEAETLEQVIREARDGLQRSGAAGEIVVADNGSTDGSPEIAERAGARVVRVSEKGYGNALMGGIGGSRGQFIIMGDADASYDFRQIPEFLALLRQGFALVMGCRLPSGGGSVMPGAMPFLHRWWGNPMFSWMMRRWFHSPIHDVHCGLRAFTRDHYDALDLRCTGMEFASEMVIKTAMSQARIAEVPITLRPDQRITRAPHLRTFRDGWRHLRFYLMYSPRWLFFVPGIVLFTLGVLGYALALPGTRLAGLTFDVNTLLFASLFVILGYQSVLFAILAKTFAVGAGLQPASAWLTRFLTVFTVERGLLLGALTGGFGVGLLGFALMQWAVAGFGNLDYPTTLRWTIPGVMFSAIGAQTVFSSFFASMLGLQRR
jgi:glycosyltransferase involved in cell wall biosynthesis